MLIAQIDFEILESIGIEKQSDAIWSVIGSFLKDERFLDENFAIFQTENTLRTFVSVPAKDALENFSNIKYISASLQNLNQAGLSQPIHRILGTEI